MEKTISNECIKAIREIAIKQIKTEDEEGTIHSIKVLTSLIK